MKKWPLFLVILSVPAYSYVNLTGAFFSNGGYKVAKQDLWPLGSCSTCTIGLNWDGTTAKIGGLKNEMIGGLLLLQGGASDATNVHVAISPLNGPSGSVISSTPTLCAATTGYTTREFEIFVATYVQIQGMTENSWNTPEYDEHDVPVRFRNSSTLQGSGNYLPDSPNLWSTRPDANKFMPDALIPEECVSSFTVSASSSQAVWLDFYLKKTLNAGTYTGTITVTEGVTVSTTIPIQITVYNGTMPDQPNLPYLADVSEDDINYRLNGVAHNAGCSTAACIATDEAFYQALWRHRIVPIGDAPDTSTNEYPSAKYQLALSGNLFTSGYGYQGPGLNTGLPVYSIGTYAKWTNNGSWSATDPSSFCVAVSSWGYWFKNNAPSVRSFVYLADEPASLTNTNKWSTWMSTITACQTSGYTVHSFVTSDWPVVVSSAPYLDNPASTDWTNKNYQQTDWQSAATRYITSGSTKAYGYNGHPSWAGSSNATEDDGMSSWEGPWAAYLKGVQGWFNWQTTSWYIQGQGSPAENPLWTQAKTFGYDSYPSTSATRGHYGFDYGNGDGVLLYPGTEVSTYTASNVGVLGPIASLRLKTLRRGINDYDYLTMAYAVNPSSTTSILTGVVPSALWDINCYTYSDCTYSYGGRLWSQDPQAWESARSRLATIITGGVTPVTNSKTFSGSGTFSGGGTYQ